MIHPLEFRREDMPEVSRTNVERLNAFFREVREELTSKTETIDLFYIGGDEIDVLCETRAKHVLLTRCVRTDAVPITAAVSALEWTWRAKRLTLPAIRGLSAGVEYSVRLLVIGA